MHRAKYHLDHIISYYTLASKSVYNGSDVDERRRYEHEEETNISTDGVRYLGLPQKIGM
jgi:hypothetical protein